MVTVGGVVYTKDQAIALMGQPKKGDSTLILFFQLVAAKLNIAAGAPASCISTTIAAADAFLALAMHPPGSGFKSNSAESLAAILAAYNADNTSPCGVTLCPTP
jgi:hypothetical protein